MAFSHYALLCAAALVLAHAPSAGQAAPCSIGVNYAGPHFTSNPLAAGTAVKMIEAMGASYIKLYTPEKEVIQAVAGSGMTVVVGVYPHERMTEFATKPGAALAWLKENILPYKDTVTFSKISVANELVDPGVDPVTMSNVVPGMWALYRALRTLGLHNQIKVVSPQHPGFVPNPEPPSNATIHDDVKVAFVALLDFVTRTGSHLYITNMPFYAYKDYGRNVSRNFAMFTGFDGYYDVDGRYYQNSFDQNLDAVLSVAAKLGFPDVGVEIAETGWPTRGATVADVKDAKDYLEGVLGKVCSGQGTPRRPGLVIPTAIFEAFDQDQKAVPGMPWEPFWGLSDIYGKPKFPLNLKAVFPAPPALPPNKWCVLKPGSAAALVSSSIAFACARGVNCEGINKACPPQLRASAIYHAYYQEFRGQKDKKCELDFAGTGHVVLGNPGAGSPACPFPGKPSFALENTAAGKRQQELAAEREAARRAAAKGGAAPVKKAAPQRTALSRGGTVHP